MVGASLEVMDRDARRMRAGRPFVMTNLRDDLGVVEVAATLLAMAGLPWRLQASPRSLDALNAATIAAAGPIPSARTVAGPG
jgi:hypothetical protein